MSTLNVLALLFAILVPHSVLKAQFISQTHIIEAYNCDCVGTGRPLRSIQLGVRLDPSLRIHTALSTLVGCGRIVLNVAGERYPFRITMANARDNVATLEPIELATSIPELQKRFKRSPNFAMFEPSEGSVHTLYMVILQGASMTKQKRAIRGISLQPVGHNGVRRYSFRMESSEREDLHFDELMGGPVWVEQGKDLLSGIVTGITRDKSGFDVVVAPVENMLERSQDQLYHAFLATYREEVNADCSPKQLYWDGFGTYRFRTSDRPSYQRISPDERWDKSLRKALLRIRAHMADSIPAKGNNREGDPSLCVFANDLENVHLAFNAQASATEQENWRVLPRFVKAYSSVFCKQRKYSDSEFTRDILELNFWMDQIGGEEMRLLYDLGYDWRAFETFVKRYFMLSQVSSIRKRYDGLMAETENLADPCTQRLMLNELNGSIDAWVHYVGRVNDPDQMRLLDHRRVLSVARDSSINAQLTALRSEGNDRSYLLQLIENDSCLSSAERMVLLRAAREISTDSEQLDLDYGIDVVEHLRTSISTAFGEDALANVITRIFRVEDGVGVELTIRGGGAILDRRLHGRAGNASDTTTVYRSGFPLGSIGDTLSATIVRVFWERICDDYASRKWAFRTESIDITGMADGVPVRSNLPFTKECIQEITDQGVIGANEQLAFARAWSLREQLAQGDRCGLYGTLNPTIRHQTFSERGGQYRGVTMRAVMKRL